MTSVRLRAVAVAVLVTALTCGSLAAWALAGDDPDLRRAPFLATVAAAAAGTVALWRLPWPRLLAGRFGLVALYAWTTADMVLISVALHLSGGADSALFFLYALPMVFGAALYPWRGLAVVVAVAMAGYAAVAAADAGLEVDLALLRVSFLGTLAVLAGFLSQLVTAAYEADARRAALLEAVAVGTRSISRLRHDEVLRAVIEAVAALGFDASNIAVFDEDGVTYRVVHGIGHPAGYGEDPYPADLGMPGLVREAGRTVVVDDYASHPRAVPVVRDAGFRSVVAAPIFVGGRLAAALVGGTRERRPVADEEVEAIELLADQAGVALANAARFEDEHRMVARLEELDRLKQDFVANVSHELRTPLTVVKGLGKTLAQRWEVLSDEVRAELIGRLNDNADALGMTIDNLLDFSRLEAGRLEVRPTEFDLGDLVRRVSVRLGPLFQQRELVTDVATGVHVTADPQLIERVCENLLSNAAKHTPEGASVRVVVDASGAKARVSVQDDGPGIPPHELSRLGARFFRGGDVNTRRTRGAGLGLAFAREVLELHGSRLEAASAVGVGSAFAFALPLSRDLVK